MTFRQTTAVLNLPQSTSRYQSFTEVRNWPIALLHVGPVGDLTSHTYECGVIQLATSLEVLPINEVIEVTEVANS